jgi:hypothetical protein
MAHETSVTRKTLERNLRRGRWVLVGTYDANRSRYVVVVPKAKKTLAAGRTMYVDIHETREETEARLAKEQAEALARIRAINASRKS